MKIVVCNSLALLSGESVNIHDVRLGSESIKERFSRILDFCNIEYSFDSRDINEIQEKKNNTLYISAAAYLEENDFINFIRASKNSAVSFSFLVGNSLLIHYQDTRFYESVKELKISQLEFLKNLSQADTLEQVIAATLPSRKFNDLKQSNEKYKKFSSEKDKLIREFEFLKGLPENLRSWYVTVYDSGYSKESAWYTMEKIPWRDYSYWVLTGMSSAKSAKRLFNYLHTYFIQSQVSGSQSIKWITDKNITRLNELKKDYGLYELLNSWCQLRFGASLDAYTKLINDELYSINEEYLKSHVIISHGDLCYSNILFSLDSGIKLIDPRGGESKRSLLYDLAKLSHSTLGGYDSIVNSKTSIQITDQGKPFVAGLIIPEAEKLEFIRLSKKLNTRLEVIRIIEASLFFSMIPLHSEDKSRCVTFLIRSIEILEMQKSSLVGDA